MHKDPLFLTNIDAGLADLALEAAEITGFDIEIRAAVGKAAREFGGLVAVRTNEKLDRDHEEFWQCFHELIGSCLEYGWCKYCEVAEATDPDGFCDICRGGPYVDFRRQ